MTGEELDARFTRLRDDVQQAILASAAESRRHAEELAAHGRAYAEELAEGSRRDTAARVAENRHFFRVIAEDLIARIQLVAEGVTTDCCDVAAGCRFPRYQYMAPAPAATSARPASERSRTREVVFWVGVIG